MKKLANISINKNKHTMKIMTNVWFKKEPDRVNTNNNNMQEYSQLWSSGIILQPNSRNSIFMNFRHSFTLSRYVKFPRQPRKKPRNIQIISKPIKRKNNAREKQRLIHKNKKEKNTYNMQCKQKA